MAGQFWPFEHSTERPGSRAAAFIDRGTIAVGPHIDNSKRKIIRQ
jgi:hypothetical protein